MLLRLRPLGLCIAALALASAAAAQEAGVGHVVVALPADARLFFEGHLTEQAGETRSFVTPPLAVGTESVFHKGVFARIGG